MKAHKNIFIRGKVQGTFFRQAAKNKAEELGIRGFARNQPDGSMYIEAEGENGALEEFILWCWTGPPMAAVEGVKVELGEIQNFSSFSMRH